MPVSSRMLGKVLGVSLGNGMRHLRDGRDAKIAPRIEFMRGGNEADVSPRFEGCQPPDGRARTPRAFRIFPVRTESMSASSRGPLISHDMSDSRQPASV